MNDSANPAMEPNHWDIGVAALSVDESFGTKLLPFVLSVTAGSVDIIGFLGLGGLFTAHITGNIVVLAAKLVAGEARILLLHIADDGLPTIIHMDVLDPDKLLSSVAQASQ